jgi:glycosyltransferase involved in cell wall biosynthesis
VACALAQTGVDVEVIVVDDGSPTPLTLPAHPRLRVLRNDVSLGPAAARNRGIEEAAGRWTAMLDDDDIWVPEKIERQLAAAEAMPGARWVGCGALLVDPHLRALKSWELPPEGEVEDLFLARNRLMAGGSVALVDTALLRDVGGFAAELRNFEDWDLWIRLAQASPLAVCDSYLTAYVRAAGGVSHDVGELEEAFGRVADRWAARRQERGVPLDARTGSYLAEMAWRAGDRNRAARLYFEDARGQGGWRALRRAALALVPGTIHVRDWRARR